MDKKEFLEAVQHECRGFVLEAMLHVRKGSEASIWLKATDTSMRARLVQLYDLHFKVLPASNGEPKAPAAAQPKAVK